MAECIEEGTLRAYADGALMPEQEAVVSAHVAHCARCSRNLVALNALASEVSSFVIDNSYVPDPRIALAQVRSMMPAAETHPAADISRAPFVAFTGEAQKRRVSPRPMRLQPVAMGAGLGASMVAVLLLLFAVSGLRQTAYQPASEFVPKGMVRQLEFSHTIGVVGQPATHLTSTVWLANGQNHLLMYSTMHTTSNMGPIRTWVEEQAVYGSEPYKYGEKIVRKLPYDARHLDFYVPNEISHLMTIPNARILGDGILDGRPVTMIEAIADKNPQPNPNVPYDTATDVRLWVDKETSQVLQRQNTTTFLSGKREGEVEVNTMKVIKNELKDASQFAPDFFTYKPSEGVTVVEAPSPFGDMPTATPQAASQSSEFVPEGMVRHLVVSDTTTSSDPNATKENTEPNTHKREIWYANGAEHLLMRTSITGEGSDGGYFVWVDDDAVYTYNAWGGKVVEKSPYRIEDLGPYAPNPDIITKSLNLPNAQVVGYSTLNGRPVVEIESPDISEKIYSADSGAALNVGRRLWIDTQENRVLQRQDIIPNTVGQSAGTVVTMTGKVVLDELKRNSELPADFFKFKLPEGTTLVDVPSSEGTSSTPPTPMAWQSDWYEFTSDRGGFVVLMPHTPEEQGYGSGMQMIGAREPSVTYIVTYIGHPKDVVQKPDPEKWLDDASYRALLEVDGKVLSEKPVSLGQHPGREIMLERTDGRHTRSRLYSTGGRLYNVYAIAAKDRLASPEVERYLNSFKLLGNVSEFVPQDKVRYMKVVRTWKSPGIDNGRTDELWLGNGKEHLLLRTNTLHVDVSQHVREHGVTFTRVTNEAVYVYYKFGEDAYRYYKYPYDPRFIEPYVPQDINSLLTTYNAQVVGDDTLSGRAVTLIKTTQLPDPIIRPPDPNEPEHSLTSVRLWVDKESSLVLRREDFTFYFSGPRSGTTETQTMQIMENELRDRSTVTVDFFDYEPGGIIIDSGTSPFDATPTPDR